MEGFEDALKNALETYSEVKFTLVAKRMELDGVRDFHARVMWTCHKDAFGSWKPYKESVWEGFETEAEAVADFIKEFSKSAS